MKMMTDIKQTIKDNINKNLLILPGEHVGVAVSGGVDSMCLLDILAGLKDDLSITITVLHFEHGIRGEASKQDAVFVAEACKQYGLPLVAESADVPKLAECSGMSLETSARQARYDFFRRMTGQYHLDKIALAHHMGDQAETVLLNLIRGSGTKGLTGMRMFREPNYIRPMLDIAKPDILAYAESNKIAFSHDATNDDIVYTRNRLRKTIVPELCAINTDAEANIARTAGILADEDRYLDQLAKEAYGNRVSQKDGEVVIALSGWDDIDIVLKRRIIRSVLDQYFSLINVEFIHIAVIINISLGENGKRAQIMNDLFAAKTYDSLTLFREKRADTDVVKVGLTDTQMIDFGDYRFKTSLTDQAVLENGSECFDLDRLSDPVIRTVREDDYIVPLGMKGRKKLSDYLCDKKVPLHRRVHAVVMAQGCEVIWAVGCGINDNYKVSQMTRRVLKISAEKMND